MKSWKTTVAGIMAGAPVAIDALVKAYEAGTFTGKTRLQLIASVGIILFGLWAKDNNVTGGTIKQK